MSKRSVIVVIGAGGMGMAVVARMSKDRTVLLADSSQQSLDQAKITLTEGGHQILTHLVDITKLSQVVELAQRSISIGSHLDAVVHTAGLSPTQADTSSILAVDLLGTANIIDAFLEVAQHGTVMTCIASVAGHSVLSPVIDPEFERYLATAPSASLLSHPKLDTTLTPQAAYPISKRANILRVQGFAKHYGLRGARINSISPGVILTPMSQTELNGPYGEYMKQAVEASAAARFGRPDDIASAVEWLCSSGSSYITGTDILVDGGLGLVQKAY